PGEIAAIIREHPGVADAVVVVSGKSLAERRLVAYVVASDAEEPIDVAGLRSRLRASVPEGFLPAAFLVLPALPLTASGKIDRSRLPAPSDTPDEQRPSFVEPRDELEATVCAVWAKVLKEGRVGIDDSFFDLGGHSLLVVAAEDELSRSL